MDRRRFATVVSLLCLSLALLPAAPAASQSLQGELDVMLQSGQIAGTGCKIGVCILDPKTGDILASSNEDASFIPASNMKLLTSGAALAVLGPDFSFKTRLLHDRNANRVVVVGSGDPALADPKLLAQMGIGVDQLLDDWAAVMKKAGVPAGCELVVDDRVFDREFVHPTWPVGQLNRWYCAEVAGLNFHTNYLTVYTDPRAHGAPPGIRVEPDAGWLEVSNKARSVEKGQHTAWAARVHETNDITLYGDIRFATDPVEVTLHDMPAFFSRLLAQAMEKRGIAPSTFRVAGPDEDLSDGATVLIVRTRLETILDRCNTDSYNLYAESLLKRLGHEKTKTPGSWSTGAAVMRIVLLDRLGPSSGQAIIVADGSGMSRENRVTPRMLAEWLDSFHDDPDLWGPFYDSLPIAGVEGTLDRRFKRERPRNEVRAKSGYLTGVSALSGYVRDPETGRSLVFSVVTNEKPNKVPLSWVRRFEEQVVLMCDEWITRKTADDHVQVGG